MARRRKHEEHTNHEAWAIPYGDLITLLLALFVCMYAVSSVNEGRFRVLADSLNQAFGGPPRSDQPIQIGDRISKNQKDAALLNTPDLKGFHEQEQRQLQADAKQASARAAQQALQKMADQVRAAFHDLIDRDLVVVHPGEHWLEVQIRTDILFASGSAAIAGSARPVLDKLAAILQPFPNAVRIEGHTDNVPIATKAFPSNWELSAARAASVVHLFSENGVQDERMSVSGYAQYRPLADNDSAQGRNRNRRVVIVVMEAPQAPAADAQAPQAAPPPAPAPSSHQEVPNG